MGAARHLDAAFAAYENGDRAAARRDAEAALAVDVSNGDALNLLAILAQEENRQSDAEAFIRRALKGAPQNPIYLNTLGNGLIAQGRSDEAVAALESARRGIPDQPDILFNLANAHRQAGHMDDAIACYRTVTLLRPGHVGAYNNLAVVLKSLGDAEGAAAVLIEAAAHAPKSAELRFNLGNALQAAGQLAAAESAYRRTLELQPAHAEAHANLGVVLAEAGLKKQAEDSFRKAIALNPDLAPAYVGLADLVDDGGMDAVAHRRAVLALKPDLAAIRSSLLMCLHYTPEATREDLKREHLAFGALHDGKGPPAFAPAHDFTPDRKLRVGFVSGDFRFHAMLFFLKPVLQARDPDAIETVCYSTTAKPDGHTRGFHAVADVWRDVRALATQDLVDLIVRDRIDILIDVSGHAPHNRLLAFAARPAPLQVAWGDYVNTRGLKAIDILLGDPVQTPPEDDGLYAERVVRFAPDYICYRPPPYAPPLATAPCLKNGCVTFGTFSEVTKIGAASVKQWAAVLRAVPEARFLLNNYLLADDARQGRILSLFMDEGIGTDRLIFATGGPHPEFLAQYSKVDVILDTAPYSGGLTTCESLLMGVPALTVPGDRFCGRHAAAHLLNGGYADGVCETAEEMAAKAAALARDHAALSSMRRKVRADFLASRVCDVNAFAVDFYGTLRKEWAALCAAHKP